MVVPTSTPFSFCVLCWMLWASSPCPSRMVAVFGHPESWLFWFHCLDDASGFTLSRHSLSNYSYRGNWLHKLWALVSGASKVCFLPACNSVPVCWSFTDGSEALCSRFRWAGEGRTPFCWCCCLFWESFHCVDQNSQRSARLCLPSARIKGGCHSARFKQCWASTQAFMHARRAFY